MLKKFATTTTMQTATKHTHTVKIQQAYLLQHNQLA